MYIHQSLHESVSQVSTLPTVKEATCLEVELRGGDKLLLRCVYRSPNSSDENNEAINNVIYPTCSKAYTHIYLMASDFSAPHINWDL